METITDADNADDLALLTNTPAQGKFQLHSLEQAARGIGLNVNLDRTESMRFSQDGSISLNDQPLELVEHN